MDTGSALTLAESFKKLNSYLSSRQWWMFLTVEPIGTVKMGELESRFYSGKKNDDFHLMMIPIKNGLLGIGLGKKAHLSAKDLSQFVNAAGTLAPTTPGQLEQQDILFLSSASMPRDFSDGLIDWLAEKVGPIGKVN